MPVMANFETVLTHRDPSLLRVIVVALKAHGFHPLEDEFSGLPGLPGVSAPRGMGVQVPEAEAEDARALVDVLLAEMTR